MVTKEPILRVGIIDGRQRINGEFAGEFDINGRSIDGAFAVFSEGQSVVLSDLRQNVVARGNSILCVHRHDSTFTLHDVTIGSGFHWERNQIQAFRGDALFLRREEGTVVAINVIPLEQYLASVISSEMNASAPFEFLKAHAITSRSWLIAMLERKSGHRAKGARTLQNENELIRWYDREDHDLYDVCADDHCQRYQGIMSISAAVTKAVEGTNGQCLVHEHQVCDARFSKSCGGLTEQFESCWGDIHVPYLESVSDSIREHKRVVNESDAEEWIRSSPEAYCNTSGGNMLRQILPSFDRETTDSFRWKVIYRREKLESLLQEKSGFDFGTLQNLVPVERGPSGRIVKLRIEGTRRSIAVGKELEIRRWLSKSHLYSSAFIVEREPAGGDFPERFILHGAGWGHGVGLCQIGAAVMAMKGMRAEEILKHYFRGAELKKLY